jgi:hypothetical protein
MTEFIGFVESKAAPGTFAGQADLAERWRSAYARIRELELTDRYAVAGADELGANLAPQAAAVLQNPLVQRAFALFPFRIGMVDLDNLIVHQKHINVSYVDTLLARLGDEPTDEDIFHFALPLDRRYDVPVQAARTAANAWTFTSRSNDFRPIDITALFNEDIPSLPLTGAASAILAASVGYGSNMLSAIEADGRLILHNGSHRAYTLREAGHRQAPCLIQHVEHAEELEAVGVPELVQRQDVYIGGARPPLLKDYFDPELRIVLDAPRTARQVVVQWGFSAADVPAA